MLPDKFFPYLLNFAVFVCGAILMIFELTGSRMLAPYLGTSIYVWTCLIGVILGSLSAGYHLGGKLADKRAQIDDFSLLLFLAAICLALTTFANKFFLETFNLHSFGPYGATLIASIILFAPTSLILGMASPYAAKLKINRLDNSGSTVGSLYALSTFGSIIGTFSADFFLIPFLGTIKILFFLSWSLFLIAWLICPRQNKYLKISELVILFLWSLFFSFLTGGQTSNAAIIAEVETTYNNIKIMKGFDYENNQAIRYLQTDPFGTQAAIYENSDNLVFNYNKFFRLSEHFAPDAQKALMLGGCIYSYPRYFLEKNPQANIDVIEIDPGMTEVAKKYFRFQENDRLKIYHEDGRVFLNKTDQKYDLIFVDAFNSNSSIPHQLTTREAVSREYQALTDDGVVLVNLISAIQGESGLFLRAEYHTYRNIFPQVYVFLVCQPQEPAAVQNIILVALKSQEKPAFASEDKELNQYLANLYAGDIPADVPILTDDWAPVEYYKNKEIINNDY